MSHPNSAIKAERDQNMSDNDRIFPLRTLVDWIELISRVARTGCRCR